MNVCQNQTDTKALPQTGDAKNGVLSKVKRVVVRTLRVLGILEAFLAIVFGGFVGALISNSDKANSGWLWLLVILLGVIYLPLLVAKVFAQWELPASLFDHLTASQKLKDVEKELARKSSIDIFVDDAIKALNEGTCSITSNTRDNSQCLESVMTGLEKVLAAVIHRPQQVLDCDMAKFSVGAYVEVYAGEAFEKKFIVFRDDLRIQDELNGDPFGEPQWGPPKKGLDLGIRHALERAMNEAKLDFRQVSLGSKNVQLITGPIPLVCNENSANGAIWICRECIQEPPADTENVLLIFGRIVANWLFKYNECLSLRVVNDEDSTNTQAEDELEKTVANASGTDGKPLAREE